VWRDRDTLQLGIDSRRAVALSGMAGIAWLISLLDGSRDRDQVIQAAAHRGIPAETSERVLGLLALAGALDDFPAATLRVLSPPLRTRLAAELATVSLARGDTDGGALTLARRLEAQIRIHGGGRVAVGIASLLRASGVSCIVYGDPADEPPGEPAAAPFGPTPHTPATADATPAAAARQKPAPREPAPRAVPPGGAAPREAAARETPAREARTRATGPHETEPHETGPHETGPRKNAARKTGPHETGPHETGPHETGPHETGPRKTAARKTGPHETGPHETGPRKNAARKTGPHATGPRATTSRETGARAGTPREAEARSKAGFRPARPDLAVLTGRQLPELPEDLMRDRVPHLVASASEAIGVVGPLVMPGRSACLRCLDLARTDRDPAWPLILAQLAGRRPDPLACDAPLAAAVAAQAAAQALAFIDRPAEAGAVLNGTLELVLPSWQWRRRSWQPHRDCNCGSRYA
jgi:hypothetical protein